MQRIVIVEMPSANQIRRWGRLGIVFCLSAQGAIGQDSPPPKAPQTPTSKAKKTKPHSTHGTARTTAKRTSTAPAKRRGKKVATKRGQQSIDSSRAREIQAALIRQNYMRGEPSGSWDSATQDAMRRYQADQGWQSRTIPDSRALIRLGLGPSSDHLLNPESAMTAAPAASDPKAAVKQTAPDDNLPK